MYTLARTHTLYANPEGSGPEAVPVLDAPTPVTAVEEEEEEEEVG